MGADFAELVHQGVATENRPVAHADMAGQRHVVDQHSVVADDTVVAYMHRRHQQVVVADRRLRAILYRTAMNGDTLANDIVIADDQPGGLIAVFPVGGVLPDTGKLVNVVAGANAGWPPDDDMGLNDTAGADFDIGADKRPGADGDIVRQGRAGIDNGLVMNHDSLGRAPAGYPAG